MTASTRLSLLTCIFFQNMKLHWWIWQWQILTKIPQKRHFHMPAVTKNVMKSIVPYNIYFRLCLLRRPTLSSANLGFTAILLSSIFFFFVSYPSSSMNGTQSKPAICPSVSAIWKRMSEIWGTVYPLPLQIGPETQLFWTTSQLAGNFNGLYLRNKTRCT